MCPLFLKRVAITATLVFVVQSHGAQTGLPANELALNFTPLHLTLTTEEGEGAPLKITLTATRDGAPEKDVKIQWQIATQSSHPTHIDVQDADKHTTDASGKWHCEITNKGDTEEEVTFYAEAVDKDFCLSLIHI